LPGLVGPGARVFGRQRRAALPAVRLHGRPSCSWKPRPLHAQSAR
jgi:hypothetical protein